MNIYEDLNRSWEGSQSMKIWEHYIKYGKVSTEIRKYSIKPTQNTWEHKQMKDMR